MDERLLMYNGVLDEEKEREREGQRDKTKNGTPNVGY